MQQKITLRQHHILERLLENRNGLSVDALALALDISRTAVQQHFVVLEGEGYIKKTTFNKTAGRPVALYCITDKGINYFPKQYAWISELILSDLSEGLGEDGFKAYLRRLAVKLAQKLDGQFTGKNDAERLEQLIKIMAELGFQVNVEPEADCDQPIIRAGNCIYHDLAQKHKELCEFDWVLMSSLLGKEVKPLSCMAEGDGVCRFRIQEKKD